MTDLRRMLVGRRGAEKGLAAVEFALTMPIWIALLIGTADCAYSLIVNQRVDRVAYSVADLITQESSLSKATLSTMLSSASEIMSPYNFTSNGYIIVSSVYDNPSTSKTTILWQYSGGGSFDCGGTAGGCTSKIGTTGAVPALPNSMALNSNDNVIVVEVFYNFTPMFANFGLFSDNQIYRAAVYKPRLSALTATPS